MTHNFVEDYDATLEAKYQHECYVDGEKSFFEILDTAGQDEYISLLDTVNIYIDEKSEDIGRNIRRDGMVIDATII